MNYVNLPRYIRDFLIPHDNLSELVPVVDGHKGISCPLTKFVSAEGIGWFKQQGIRLKSSIILFRARCNTEGPAHIDSPYIDNTSRPGLHLYAFNFVLEGRGEMQWVEVAEHTLKPFVRPVVDLAGTVLDVYTGIPIVKQVSGSKITVLDTWTGDTGFVNIETFHRIVTTDVDRVCLSVRAYFLFPFEQAAKQVREIFQLK